MQDHAPETINCSPVLVYLCLDLRDSLKRWCIALEPGRRPCYGEKVLILEPATGRLEVCYAPLPRDVRLLGIVRQQIWLPHLIAFATWAASA